MNGTAQRRNDRAKGICKVNNTPTPAQRQREAYREARKVSNDKLAAVRAKTVAAKFQPPSALKGKVANSVTG